MAWNYLNNSWYGHIGSYAYWYQTAEEGVQGLVEKKFEKTLKIG